jgi:hypothetical protein
VHGVAGDKPGIDDGEPVFVDNNRVEIEFVDFRVLGHEARDVCGQPDHGFLVQGRAAESVQDASDAGAVQHGAHVAFLQDSDSRGHVGQEFHEASARADHGHGAEARILGGADKHLLSGFDHGLDQDAVEFVDPCRPSIAHERFVAGFNGASVFQVQQNAAHVGFVDDFTGDGFHGHGKSQFFRSHDRLLAGAYHASQNGDVIGVQKGPALFESKLCRLHGGLLVSGVVRS